MVYRVIHLIDQNIDKGEELNMKKEIEKKVSEGLILESFEDANYIFRQICREKKWFPPERLHCLASVPKSQIEKFL